MNNSILVPLLFYIVAGLTLSFALFATLSKNIVRAVFSLLGTFVGVAILYGMLSAEFIAVIQILVYVGGILVLMLFAVMLTSHIENAPNSNRSGSRFLGFSAGSILACILIILMIQTPWRSLWTGNFEPITRQLGQYLLNRGILPFEILSILLLAVLIGTVVVARTALQQNRPPHE